MSRTSPTRRIEVVGADLLIYRCWLLWSKNYWIIILPGLTAIASLGKVPTNQPLEPTLIRRFFFGKRTCISVRVCSREAVWVPSCRSSSSFGDFRHGSWHQAPVASLSFYSLYSFPLVRVLLTNTDSLSALELDELDFLWQFVTRRCFFLTRSEHVKFTSQ